MERLLADFFAFEREARLIEHRVCGVAHWPMIRLVVFIQLCQRRGYFGNAGSLNAVPLTRSDRLEMMTRFNPLLRLSRAEFVVIESALQYKTEGAARDIYTDAVASELPSDVTERIDLSGRAEPCRTAGARRHSAYVLERLKSAASRVYARLARRWLAGSEGAHHAELQAAERAFETAFGYHVPIAAIALSAVIHYLSMRFAWDLYFRLRRPRFVVLGTQSYGYEGLVAAARRHGAFVVEMQHGVIYPGHLGYHFPARDIVSDRADVLLAFGRAWTGVVPFYWGAKVESFGFPELNRLRQSLASRILNKRRQAAVLSCDPFHGDFLMEVVTELRLKFPDLAIVIRPHPSDRFDYVGRIAPAYAAMVDVQPSDVPVHHLLAESEYAVCGPSTTLFEAMAFGCKSVGVLLSFEPLLAPVLRTTKAEIARTPEEVASAMASCEPPGDMSAFFNPAPPPLPGLLCRLEAERPALA